MPCHRRLDDNFAGDAGQDEAVVRDGFGGDDTDGGAEAGGDDDGWLRTGGMAASQEARIRDVRTVDEAGNMGEREDEIPDMEDEDDDDEAIIREKNVSGTKAYVFTTCSSTSNTDKSSSPLRTYNLYVTYTPYYRTPRLYLSGYLSPSEPLPPQAMMEDIVGDYKDKTVTLEDFPFFDAGVKTASVHPCKHASVMKVLLDRADAALKIRQQKLRDGQAQPGNTSGMEGLVDDTQNLSLGQKGFSSGAAVGGQSGGGGDEWEVLQNEGGGEEESGVAIRVDQYLVVFLKFMASVTPGIEHDFTMGV